VSLESAEFHDAPAKLRELLSDQGLQVRPGCATTPLVGDPHQLPDLLQGKVEEACLPDKPKPLEIFGGEEPVAGGGVSMRAALGRREQADRFVEADRSGVHAEALGRLADFITPVSHQILLLSRRNAQDRLVTPVTARLHDRLLEESRLGWRREVGAVAVRAVVSGVPVIEGIVKRLRSLRILPPVRVALQTGAIPQRIA